MTYYRPITNADRRVIAQRLRDGDTPRHIADDLDLDPAAVASYAQWLGWVPT